MGARGQQTNHPQDRCQSRPNSPGPRSNLISPITIHLPPRISVFVKSAHPTEISRHQFSLYRHISLFPLGTKSKWFLRISGLLWLFSAWMSEFSPGRTVSDNPVPQRLPPSGLRSAKSKLEHCRARISFILSLYGVPYTTTFLNFLLRTLDPVFDGRACLRMLAILSRLPIAGPALWLFCMQRSRACGVPRDRRFVRDACRP